MRNKTTNSLIISVVTFVLVLFFTSRPITWNLNKSIGWGFEPWDYFGFGLIILILFSVFKMLKIVDLKNITAKIIVNIIVNLISIFLMIKFLISIYLLIQN